MSQTTQQQAPGPPMAESMQALYAELDTLRHALRTAEARATQADSTIAQLDKVAKNWERDNDRLRRDLADCREVIDALWDKNEVLEAQNASLRDDCSRRVEVADKTSGSKVEDISKPISSSVPPVIDDHSGAPRDLAKKQTDSDYMALAAYLQDASLRPPDSDREKGGDYCRSDEVENNRGYRQDYRSDRRSYEEKKERDRQQDSEEQEDSAYTERRERRQGWGTAVHSKDRWVVGAQSPTGNERDPYKEIKRLNKELEDAHHWQRHWQKAHEREVENNERPIVPAYRDMELQLNAARRHIQALEEELSGTRTELGGVKQQLSDAVSLSKVRGEQLKCAQVFLAKDDAVSVSDVVGKVATLNDEIFQAAAALGELLVNTMYDVGVDRVLSRKRAIKQEEKNATFLLGEALVSKLASESIKAPQGLSNPPLVQIVMESALAKWCHTTCEMWRPLGHSGGETTMNKLYEDIRKTEDQAVAGRWRSLTRANLHYSTAEWTEDIMCGIRAVMAVAGWEEGPASDSSPDSPNDDLKQFKEHLASICKAVRDVRKAAGEDFTSADLEVCLVEPHTTFNPTSMEDAYGDQRGGRRKGRLARDAPVGHVASTSGLGLRMIVFEKMDEQNGGAWVPKKTTHMIAQPKVVLEKTIMEVMPSSPIRGPMGPSYLRRNG